MSPNENKDEPYVPDYSARSIGKRAQAYRKSAGLTAKEIAARSAGALTENAIAKIENGHRLSISTDTLVALARAIGVPPTLLLFPLETPEAWLTLGSKRLSVEHVGAWLLADPYFAPGDSAFELMPQWVAEAFRDLVESRKEIRAWSGLVAQNTAENEQVEAVEKTREAADKLEDAKRRLGEYARFLGLSDAD